MNLTKTKITLSYLFLFIFAVCLPSFAEHKDGMSPEDQKECMKGHDRFKDLNLTEGQEKQIKDIHTKYEADFEQKRAAIKRAREDLKVAMQQNKSDAELIKLHDVFQETIADKHDLKFRMALDIRKILTAEQKKKFKVLHEHHKWSHGKRGECRNHDEDDEGEAPPPKPE